MGQLGNISPAGSIAIGVFVGLLSTCIQSIGLTLQRKSHLLEDEKQDEESRRPPYRRRRWQVGMFMFIVANLVGSTIQITTLPLPVLSTLQASGLVFNTICASIVLGEPFTRWSLIGTLLVAGGAVLVALFGAIPEPSHNLDQHLALLERKEFILWMIGTAVMVAIILISILCFTRVLQRPTPAFRLYRGMAYGAISSILSAHSLLIASSAVELLVRTIVDHKNQFNRWQSWIILLLLVSFALSQLYFLHRGLKLVSTSVLYPFVFCVYNIFAILDGLIYFKQVSLLPPMHAGLIALGTMVLLSGVIALSWRLTAADTGPPAEPHTFLTPGMGIVEDTPTESSSATVHGTPYDSEDEELAQRKGERTPLLNPRARSASPRSQDDAILAVTKHRRRFAAGDADAIWDELQEDAGRSHRWAARSNLRRAVTMNPTTSSGVGPATANGSSTQPPAATRPRRAQTTVLNDRDKHASHTHRRRAKRRYSIWGFPIGAAGEGHHHHTSAGDDAGSRSTRSRWWPTNPWFSPRPSGEGHHAASTDGATNEPARSRWWPTNPFFSPTPSQAAQHQHQQQPLIDTRPSQDVESQGPWSQPYTSSQPSHVTHDSGASWPWSWWRPRRRNDQS